MLDKLNNKKTVLALGYFDSVHVGHQKVILTAKQLADKVGATLTIVTFSGNLKGVINGDKDKAIYNDEERKKLYYLLGADEVYFAPLTNDFLAMSEQEFLQHLNDKFNVYGYCSGVDYRFGKNGHGTIETIKEFAKINAQTQIVVDMVLDNQIKVSSTLVKTFLRNGDVKKVKELLGRAYSVSGVVFSDRNVGKSLGFPTVNIKIDKDKYQLKNGVYQGKVIVAGVSYKALINYGARPTFDLYSPIVEAHMLDFNGNLYGREIEIRFDSFLRNIEKFNSIEQLKERLNKDLEKVRNSND